MGGGRVSAAPQTGSAASPFAPRQGYFPAKAKNVIFMFMAGGPSQLELFDAKPELQKLHNKPIPDSFIAGKRFAFMSSFTKEKPKVLGTQRKFSRYGKHGTCESTLWHTFNDNTCLPSNHSGIDPQKDAFAATLHVAEHPRSFFDRIKRRIGGLS